VRGRPRHPSHTSSLCLKGMTAERNDLDEQTAKASSRDFLFTSGKGDQILFAHTGQTSFSLFKEVSPSSRPITKPLFRHESVHIQDAKTDSEMHGTLLISKRRKEKGTMQNSMNTRGTASQNQQVLDNPSNIGTSEVMFSFLFIWFSGARVVWLVPGIHNSYSAIPENSVPISNKLCSKSLVKTLKREKRETDRT
uniref:Uncharacterized protein n=1 Tax=Cairina moschata TaxID=8855 RepID=A0A8C3CHR4_CAIMO